MKSAKHDPSMCTCSGGRISKLLDEARYYHNIEESLKLINAIKEKWTEHWEAYYLLGTHFSNEDKTQQEDRHS